ncbi:hypothetical protein FAIPA1_440003 [Frankia sp. AiPs1]
MTVNVLSAADGVLAARLSPVFAVIPMTAVIEPFVYPCARVGPAAGPPKFFPGSELRECPRAVATRATVLGQRNRNGRMERDANVSRPGTKK